MNIMVSCFNFCIDVHVILIIFVPLRLCTMDLDFCGCLVAQTIFLVDVETKTVDYVV